MSLRDLPLCLWTLTKSVFCWHAVVHRCRAELCCSIFIFGQCCCVYFCYRDCGRLVIFVLASAYYVILTLSPGLSIDKSDFEVSLPDPVHFAVSVVASYGFLLSTGFVYLDSIKLSSFPVFLETAFLAFSKSHAEVLACDAALDFSLPVDFLSKDLSALSKLDFSLVDLFRAKQNLVRANRFNESRCRLFYSDDPEFSTLLSLAVTGAIVDVNPSFLPIASPDKPRSSHAKMRRCFEKHIFKLWTKGRGVALPFSSLRGVVLSGVHISPIHWTSKVDSADGRFLVDLSNRDVGSTINSEFGLEATKSRYGALHLPTIVDIVAGWHHFLVDNDLCLSECLCFKDDVSSAFCQFDFNPASSKLLSILLGDILFFFVVGLFGWGRARLSCLVCWRVRWSGIFDGPLFWRVFFFMSMKLFLLLGQEMQPPLNFVCRNALLIPSVRGRWS